MQNTADKFYELQENAIHDARTAVISTLGMVPKNSNMTLEDIYALARILAYRWQDGYDGGMYEHVVNYLWMTFRIETRHKMCLLDLLEETENEEEH